MPRTCFGVVALLFPIVLGLSCAVDAPYRSPNIVVADQGGVSKCNYLNDVNGASGWYGVFASQGFENAREEAFQQAQSLGATHLVWTPTDQPFGSSQVHGKAYRCQ